MLKRIVVLLFFVQVSFGQSKAGLELCIQYKNSFSAFSTEKEANEALDKILNVIGASKNFTLVPCDDISNALAVTFKGERFILFDGAFMRKITQLTNNWSNLFILAHEVGHHINGHTRDFLLATVLDDQSLEDRRKEELEADEFASFIVSKLGASYSEIEETIDLIASNEDDLYSTHPSYDKRIAAVKKGFDRAYSNSDSTNSSSYSTNKYNTGTAEKGEMIPRYENPRDLENLLSGSWKAIKLFRLENTMGTRINDPFEKKEYEGYTPVKQLKAKTEGKALSPYGSKNILLEVKIETYKNNYIKFSNGNGVENLHIPYKFFSIYLYNWLDAPKEIEFDYDNPTYATFEYVIDGELYGTFVTQIGWINQYYDDNMWQKLEEPKRIQPKLALNSWSNKFQQKENYEFIQRLKSGKKLYLRFGKLFFWNGHLNDEYGKFDTSKTSTKYEIPRYTYEFDLTGSSKALSF